MEMNPETITEEKLQMVGKAEQFLLDQGFRQLRVRIHGNMARIEVLPEDIARFADAELRSAVTKVCKDAGFAYVTLDLQGYRTGSMNEVLSSYLYKTIKEVFVRFMFFTI